jgi:hypothetical protein
MPTRITVAIILLFAACGPKAAAPPKHPALENKGTQGGGPTPVFAAISREACYGWCPVYSVTVHEDGTIDYDGRQFVKTTGKQTFHITAEQVKQLHAAFDASHFADWKDYTEEMITDNPSANLTYGAKTVHHYYGDTNAPKELIELESAFDKIVGSDQWIGTEEEREKLPRQR